MKCVKCGQTAEYVYISMSLCEEHLIQFQQNTLITQPAGLTPVLNQNPQPEANLKVETSIPLTPAKKKASQYLAEYAKWKGRKKLGGGYHLADGTWGWDFTDQFPPDIVSLLSSEPLVVGDYIFETNKTGTTITKRKA